MPYRHRILAKILAPSRWVHGLLNLLATFVALEVSESIFVRNQSNYVYPADGDSIGIPLMGILFYNVVALILLLIGMGMVRQNAFLRWVGYLLIVVTALGYLVQIHDWGDPLHYEIGLAQASLGVMILGYLYLEIRRHRLKIRSSTIV